MSSEKSALCVWPKRHCDLGEIRTESADRPAPPEKKERQDTEEQKRLGKNPRRRRIYIVV